MPQSIPAGLTREHVLRAIADLDAGEDHPFGKPTGYELVLDGKRYAPKAVVGLACRYSIGRLLAPEEFSGGEAPGQANFVLRRLGFTVASRADEPAEAQTGRDWSEKEVQILVDDYFAMLEAEVLGRPYSKAEHRNAIMPLLVGRSKGSVEFKHQNVSGVLVEMGLPYIDGYKPRGNYQAMLASEVEAYLDRRPGFLESLASAPRLDPPARAAIPDAFAIIEDPPEKIIAPAAGSKPWVTRKPRRIDFAERDANNRRLGKLGEEFIVELERRRLLAAGRDDLSQRVVWASRDIGDGLGFDVLSYDEGDDSERLIEVKATGQGKFSAFYVSSNEVRCSEDVPDKYQLFRVFDFGRSPRLYILHGSLRQLCQLEPITYRAVI